MRMTVTSVSSERVVQVEVLFELLLKKDRFEKREGSDRTIRGGIAYPQQDSLVGFSRLAVA